MLVDRDRGPVAGLELVDGKVIPAREAVISNADLWSTHKMVDPETAPGPHLHVGVDSLPANGAQQIISRPVGQPRELGEGRGRPAEPRARAGCVAPGPVVEIPQVKGHTRTGGARMRTGRTQAEQRHTG